MNFAASADPALLPLVSRLYKNHVRQYWRLLIGAVGLLLLVGATTSAQPLLLQVTFDKVFQNTDHVYLTLLPVALILLFTVQSIAQYYASLLMNRVGASLTADMRCGLFTHLVHNDVDFYATHNPGNLLCRVAGETISIATGVQRFFNTWARHLITTIGLVCVMLYQSVELTAMATAAFSLAVYPLLHIRKRLKGVVHRVNDSAIALNDRLLESFHGIREIKAFAKEDVEVKRIGRFIAETKIVQNKYTQLACLPPLCIQVLAGCALAFVIWYGGHQISTKQMTQGELIAFMTSLLMLARPLKSVSSSGAVMTAALVNAARYFQILDTKAAYPDKEQGVSLAVTASTIAFDGVAFDYASGREALTGVTFSIESGQTTALVGHSGSGKSTVFNLLLRFYEPQKGKITIDCHDIREVSIKSLRSNIALVSQDIVIFDDTAMNNIRYGRDGATRDEVIAAAKAARCHEFISGLPDGYDTKLGHSGRALSGGQKQRIAIARAFVRSSPILLLDEATSSLDTRTESEIQDALAQLSKGRTTIIIAHRLSTVMRADKIVVMDSGSVRAVGSHEELLNRSSDYRDLFGV